MEGRFAEIIWKNAPIGSGELVIMAEKELCWKKSTTYTMLKRLCHRGIFQNDKGVVSVIMSKHEFNAGKSQQFVEETFSGSLPHFLTAFSSRKKLSEEEITEIEALIQEHRNKEE